MESKKFYLETTIVHERVDMTTLTILIPLFGRDYATKRILNDMRENNTPFKVLFADGSGNDNSEWINNEAEGLDMEYHNFGRDNDIHQFMRKMDSACSKITTPFTVMVDDDLVSVEGFAEGVDFLSSNNDFASFREDVNDGRSIYTNGSIVAEDKLQRIKDIYKESTSGGMNSAWHDIFRTPILKKFFKIMNRSETQDFQFVQLVQKFWHLFFGKSHRGHTKPYIHHIDGDSLVQGKSFYVKYGQWVLDSRFENSARIMSSMVRCALQDREAEEIYSIQKLIIEDPYIFSGHNPLHHQDTIASIIEDSLVHDEMVNGVLLGE